MLPWGNEPNFYCEGYKGMVKVILPICFDVFFAAVEKKKPCSVESHAHPPTSSWEHGPSGPMLKVLEYDKNGLKWIRRVKKKILPAILVFFWNSKCFGPSLIGKPMPLCGSLRVFFVTLRKDNKGRSLLAISVVRMPRNVRNHPFFFGLIFNCLLWGSPPGSLT